MTPPPHTPAAPAASAEPTRPAGPCGSPRDISLTLGSHEAALRRGLYAALLNAVRSLAPPGSAVLDVGCGRGELLRLLGEAGFEPLGLDPEPDCVAASRAFGPAEVGGLNDLADRFGTAGGGRRFGAVVCSHVLEHVPEAAAGMKSLAAVGAAGVVVAVPNVLRPARVVRAFRGGDRPDHPRHVYGWGRPELAVALGDAGLRVDGWFCDRVTFNPVGGRAGGVLTRALEPLETRLLPRLLPGLSSSLIAACRPADAPAPDASATDG